MAGPLTPILVKAGVAVLGALATAAAKMYDSNCKMKSTNKKTYASAALGVAAISAATALANKAINKDKNIEVQAGSIKAKISNKDK